MACLSWVRKLERRVSCGGFYSVAVRRGWLTRDQCARLAERVRRNEAREWAAAAAAVSQRWPRLHARRTSMPRLLVRARQTVKRFLQQPQQHRLDGL